MIIKLALIFFWLFISPCLTGKFLVYDRKDILKTWIMGNILQMAIYYVIAIPMILLKGSFYLLTKIYAIIIVILLIVSLIFSIKKKDFKYDVKGFLKQITFFQIIAIILIGGQLIYKINYANINNDDNDFVVISNDIIRTDKMYLTNTTTGNLKDNLTARRALAPISAYYSTISVLTNTQVTILTHTIIPILFISVTYGIYYYFAKKVLSSKDSIYIFLIIVSFLSLFAFSLKGANRYLILYSWLGRAFLGGAVLPLIWLQSFDAMNKESNKFLDWLNIFILVLASCLLTEMAVPLVSISIAVLSLINTIKDKKPSYLLKSVICVIPCLIIGITYLIIK